MQRLNAHDKTIDKLVQYKKIVRSLPLVSKEHLKLLRHDARPLNRFWQRHVELFIYLPPNPMIPFVKTNTGRCNMVVTYVGQQSLVEFISPLLT